MKASLVHLNPILKVKINVVNAMPTPGSTRERKAKAHRRLLKNAKANGIDADVGAVTTGEGPSGNLSLWHGLPASDLHSWPTSSVTSVSIRIVADVAKCHNISNWESRPLSKKTITVAAEFFSFV